jgi:hypothetical protein
MKIFGAGFRSLSLPKDMARPSDGRPACSSEFHNRSLRSVLDVFPF